MRILHALFAVMFMALTGVVAIPQPVFAQSPVLRQRMLERLPKIDALKAEGVVGENNQGFLSERAALGPAQASLVADENADRVLVYEDIARRSNTDAATVGRERAEQIADRAAPGCWLQDKNGRWYRK
jgi:hypothetical protein